MAISVSQLANDIQTKLRDESGDQYSTAIIQRYMYDGECEIISLNPEAYAVDTTHTCANGSLQTLFNLTPRAMQFLGIIGSSDGTAPTLITREDLTKYGQSGSVGTTPRAYYFDSRNKLKFYVWPRQTGSAVISIRYAPYPTDYGATTTVNEEYRGALIDYAMFRCLEDDAEGSSNLQKANIHRQAFYSYLGATSEQDRRVSPHNPENNA